MRYRHARLATLCSHPACARLRRRSRYVVLRSGRGAACQTVVRCSRTRRIEHADDILTEPAEATLPIGRRLGRCERRAQMCARIPRRTGRIGSVLTYYQSSMPSPLGELDPLNVPLPHGTEVTTRVAKLVGDRRIPQGVVGRVVRARDGGCDVQIVGVGEVWYTREELLPRRPGQMQFARRRAAAWDALLPCAVLEAIVGSRAWGLADEESDTDKRGIFALPFPWTAGLLDPPRDLVSADGSSTYWEIRKAVEQALRADPNTLELLFLPEVRAFDPIGEWLIAERDVFVSRDIFGSFGRYAVSQLRKLTRSFKLAEHRDFVLEWLCEDPPPDLDGVARRLARISPRAATSPGNAEL